jgi:hypothetical protein
VRTATTFTGRAEEMGRKRLYVLKCQYCNEIAIKEVWFSEQVADFSHMCQTHWDLFVVDGVYMFVYKLRS